MFGVTHRGHGCKCIVYAWLIVIYLGMGTKLFCGGGGKIESEVRGGGHYIRG